MTKLFLTIFLSILGITALHQAWGVGEISNADIFNAPFINGPTIIGGTSTGNAATATTLAPNPAALNSIGITGSETITALATPAAPAGTPSTVGGTVAASTTNYASIVALDSVGTVTGTQSAAVITTGTTSSIAWVGTPVTGAVSYQFWLSTTSGVYTNYHTSSTASFTQTAPSFMFTLGTFPAGNSTGSIQVGTGANGIILRSYSGASYFGIYSAGVVPSNINYSLASNSTTTIVNAGSGGALLSINGTAIVSVTATGAAINGALSSTGSFKVGTAGISISPTTPTIASGFGTSPTITANANTSAFQVNVGTGGTATGGVIAMPAATIGWACRAEIEGTDAAIRTKAQITSTTQVTLTNELIATGVPQAWAASTVLTLTCTGL